MTYVGIDLGTSGVKAMLMDDDQTIFASTTAPLSVLRPHSGWSEQDPADWISAIDKAMLALKEKAPKELAAATGLGLSGQMHGATLIDSAQKVLRPCMLWNDTRSSNQAARLDVLPFFRAKTGNIVFPGFTAPKLAWVRDEEPDIFDRIDKVLLPKDFLRLWLTGEAVSDMSDAAGTAWLDVGARDWDADLLAYTGLEPKHMPRLVEGSAPSGTLKAALCDRWGLANSVIVAGGAGDNAASACGLGSMNDGDAFLSLGTSGVLFAATASYRPKPESAVHAFCHAVPNTWHQMGVILSATDALAWLASLLKTPEAELTQALGTELKPPAQGVCLPYFSGERTPHNDAKIRASFVGIGHGDGAEALTQAVLEGVGFALKDNLMALAQAGTQIQRLTAVGGGARSAYWLKVLATILDVPIDQPSDGDFGAAFGAARLGMAATLRACEREQVFTPARIRATIEPNPTLKTAFADQYGRFSQLYPAIKEATS